MPDRTETEAAASLAAQPRLDYGDGNRLTLALPEGWSAKTVDLERFAAEPTRTRGTSYVHDAESFIAAVKRRRLLEAPSPVVYADASANQLVALLNDDDDENPGWRDYRVELALRSTPEWTLWKGSDGKLMGQEAFAEHIEAGLNELVAPDPATMLEIAQTFHATTNAAFKSGTRLASGVQQFRYEEEQSATAGGGGTIEIPARLELVLAPFYGSARYEVGAWFRYRISRENFTLGYKLDRPHEVERAAFADVRNAVKDGLGDLEFIAGPCPAPTLTGTEADHA